MPVCLKKLTLRFLFLFFAKSQAAAVSWYPILWCDWPGLFLVIAFVNAIWPGFSVALCLSYSLRLLSFPKSWKNLTMIYANLLKHRMFWSSLNYFVFHLPGTFLENTWESSALFLVLLNVRCKILRWVSVKWLNSCHAGKNYVDKRIHNIFPQVHKCTFCCSKWKWAFPTSTSGAELCPWACASGFWPLELQKCAALNSIPPASGASYHGLGLRTAVENWWKFSIQAHFFWGQKSFFLCNWWVLNVPCTLNECATDLSPVAYHIFSVNNQNLWCGTN